MQYRCPTAELVAVGMVAEYELQFRGAPTNAFATIVPKHGSSVPVALWEIEPQDEQRLDRYEGYPKFYFKQDIEVDLGDRSVTAMAYLMDQQQKIGMPSTWYYSTVLEGYRDCGLDETVLESAYRLSEQNPFRIEFDDVPEDEMTEGGMQM